MTAVPLAQSLPPGPGPEQRAGRLPLLAPPVLEAATSAGCALSPRDLDARILAHAFSACFDSAVAETADGIAGKARRSA